MLYVSFFTYPDFQGLFGVVSEHLQYKYSCCWVGIGEDESFVELVCWEGAGKVETGSVLVIKMKRFPLEVEVVSLPGSALLWILFFFNN